MDTSASAKTLKWQTTTRGKDCLVHKGAIFTEKYVFKKSGAVLFKCKAAGSGCKASVTLDRKRLKIVSKKGQHECSKHRQHASVALKNAQNTIKHLLQTTDFCFATMMNQLLLDAPDQKTRSLLLKNTRNLSRLSCRYSRNKKIAADKSWDEHPLTGI